MLTSLRTRFLFFIVGPIVIVYLVLLATFYVRWKTQATTRADEELAILSEQQARQFDFALRSVMSVADSLADSLETYSDGSPEQLFGHIERSVSKHPLVFGSAIAFVPNGYPGRRLFSPYVCRTPKGLRHVDIATVYDYTQPRWEWFSKTVEAGRGIWTEPYFDEGAGNILMCTYAMPFFRNGRLLGVATIDISLSELNKNVPWPERPAMDFFVVTSSGRYVYPVAKNERDVTTLLGKDKASRPESIVRLAQQMLHGKSGLLSVSWGGQPTRVGFAPVPNANWSIGARLTEAEIVGAAASRIRQTMLILGLSLLIIVAAIYYVVGRLLNPLNQLSQATRQIARGDWKAPLDIRRGDELGQLAGAFHEMMERLREREQTLRDSRGERLAMVLEGLGGKFFTYSLDHSGNLAYVSPLVERALGYTPEEFTEEFRRLFTGNALNRGARARTEASLRGEITPAYEVEMRHKDGGVRRLEFCERPVPGERGEVVAVDVLVGDVTERAQAAEWFRELVESTPEALVITDPQGKIVLVNHRAEALFGYGRDEFVGYDARQLCSTQREDAFSRWQWNSLEESRREQGEPTEIFGLRKSGEVFPLELSQSVLQFDQGDAALVATVVRDITERRQAEEKLRQVNEQLATRTQELARALRHTSRYFNSILDNSPAAIWAKDSNGVYLFANNAYREIFHVGNREIEGCTDDDFFPAEFAANFRTNDRRVIESQVTERMVEPVGGVGGVDYVVSVKFPLFDEHRNVVAAGGICLDITEQLKMQDELKSLNDELEKRVEERTAQLVDREQRFKAIVENMQGGYMQVGMDGTVQYANPGIVQILGYESVDEVEGKSTTRDIYWDNNDRNSVLETLRQSGVIENYEVALRRKDGSPVWVEINIHYFYDSEGNPLGVEGLLRDITMHREAREALERARQAADEANQAKSDFLANMSHEIRTPMNAVLGLTHLALRTELDAKQRNYLTKIDTAARNLLGILNDILDFSKIEAGKLHVEQSAFELEEVLRNVAELFTLKAEEKGIELLFHWTPGVPSALVGDALRLGQVLINLVSNALKFTEQGEIEVKVEKLSESAQNVELQFSVRDTGIGLTAQQQGRLFQAFTQADASITRRYGGTGLGLTICKRLVTLMGGEIRVESVPGEGSTFTFTVSLQQQLPALNSTSMPEIPLAGLNILIVDDNATAHEILQKMLESFHFKCQWAQSGAEAIQLLQQAEQPFDLVIMDWMMPGMNGFETIARLRALTLPFELPPVMMVSAHGREELMHQARDLDISHFLIKPVSPSVLLDSTLQVLGKAGRSVSATHDLSLKQEESVALHGARVLVVEDVDINQEIIREILHGAGINVTIADNGEKAIALIERVTKAGSGFDAVLMDCQMPVLDGYETTRRLRSDQSLANLPIIAMTANAMADDAQKCLSVGMNDYLSKPIQVPELFAVLSQWIKMPDDRPLIAAEPLVPADGTKGEFGQPGINVVAGLSHVQGNTKLYRKILLKFRDSQADLLEQLRLALSCGDVPVAVRLLHTLKGLAGNIGATTLSKTASLLEMELHNKTEGRPEELMQKLEADMIPVLVEIEGFAGGTESQEEAPKVSRPVDREAVKPLLEPLRAALLENDAGAVKIVAQLCEVLRDTSEEETMQTIARTVEDYDFDKALRWFVVWQQSRF